MEREGNQSLKAALDQEKGEIIMRKNTWEKQNWRDEKYDGQTLQHKNFKISKVR